MQTCNIIIALTLALYNVKANSHEWDLLPTLGIAFKSNTYTLCVYVNILYSPAKSYYIRYDKHINSTWPLAMCILLENLNNSIFGTGRPLKCGEFGKALFLRLFNILSLSLPYII